VTFVRESASPLPGVGRQYRLLADAQQYRFRAEELRTVADDMQDESCKRTTYRLAADYDRMACNAERQAKEAAE
jgi:hypothetical protein